MTILVFSLGIGALLVAVGWLIVYVSSLVKSAYQLKVEIQAQLEEGIRKLEEDMEKKSRWIKRDVLEELEKIKAALTADNARKFEEFAGTVTGMLTKYEEAVRRERLEVVQAMEKQNKNILTLDQRLRALRREWRRSDPLVPLDAAAEAADGQGAAEEPPAEGEVAAESAAAPPEPVVADAAQAEPIASQNVA